MRSFVASVGYGLEHVRLLRSGTVLLIVFTWAYFQETWIEYVALDDDWRDFWFTVFTVFHRFSFLLVVAFSAMKDKFVLLAQVVESFGEGSGWVNSHSKVT
jgi:hypothetical protein